MLATRQAHDLSWIAQMEQEANTNPERRRYIAHSEEVGAILKTLITGSDAYAGL
jgi:predicted alpha/beta hydrolase family esterase